MLVGWCGYYFIHSCVTSLPESITIAHGVICRSHSYYQQYNNTRLILLLLLQDSSWPVGFHGIAIFAAGLSVIRGVATTETSE